MVNSSGNLFIENSQIQYKFAGNLFFLDESKIQIIIIGFSFLTLDNCDNECFLIQTSNSVSSFIISSFFLNTTNSLISSDNNLNLIVSEGILSEPKMVITGENNIIYLNSIQSFMSYKSFALIFGENNYLNILNSFFMDIYQSEIVLYPDCSNNTIVIFNCTFKVIHILLIYSYVYTREMVESNIIDNRFFQF